MSDKKVNITRTQLLTMLRTNGWEKKAVAKILGVDEASVRRACARHNIDVELERKAAAAMEPIKCYTPGKASAKGSSRVGTFVVVPDLHAQTVIWPYLAAVCEFIRDFKPSHLIQLGDIMDYECLMSKRKMKYPNFDGEDFKSLDIEFQAVSKIIEMLNGAATSDCQKILLKGNHEYRADEILRHHPEFDQLLNLQKRVDLAGWNVRPYLEKIKLGRLNFIHGEFFGENVVKKHLRIYQKNIVFGHTHMIEQSTLASPMREIPIWGATLGCLCTLNAEYMRNRSSCAEHGFGYGWFDEETGDFDCKVVRVIHGKFWAEGKRYGV